MLLTGYGCKTDKQLYDLRGSRKVAWFEPIPFGMAYIPQGSFRMGVSDQVIDLHLHSVRTVSVSSFWMDDTEITNNEYRQFINWVSDSVAVYQTFLNDLNYYKLTDRQNIVVEPVQIDWDKAGGIWHDSNKEVQQAIEPLFYQGNERFKDEPEIDYRKITYQFSTIDYQKAAQRSSMYDFQTQSYRGNIASRADFFILNQRVPVYPDTLVWIRDFTYSFNEPWTFKYFYHPAFKEYPVVGVTWEQANAFCHWRTNLREQFLAANEIPSIHPYRLPTEAEWEWAARGGLQNNHYPWGGYYTMDDKGCYRANFKPKRGNYISDSRYSARTVKVGTYNPNDYGLYDMAGNVAEWTGTAFDQGSQHLVNELNPDFKYNAQYDDPPALKRKVIRGGSWKDVAYFIQVWVRDHEYQDSARSYIGFRCVMNAIEDGQKKY